MAILKAPESSLNSQACPDTSPHTSLFSPSEAVSWAPLASLSGSGCWGGARDQQPRWTHRLLPPPCPDPMRHRTGKEKDSPLRMCLSSKGPSWLPGLWETGLSLLAPVLPSL